MYCNNILRQVTYKYLEPVKQSYCSRSVDYGKQWSATLAGNVQSGESQTWSLISLTLYITAEDMATIIW